MKQNEDEIVKSILDKIEKGEMSISEGEKEISLSLVEEVIKEKDKKRVEKKIKFNSKDLDYFEKILKKREKPERKEVRELDEVSREVEDEGFFHWMKRKFKKVNKKSEKEIEKEKEHRELKLNSFKKFEEIKSKFSNGNLEELYREFVVILKSLIISEFKLHSGITFRELKILTDEMSDKKNVRKIEVWNSFFDEIIYWAYSGRVIDKEKFSKLIDESKMIFSEV